MIFSRWPHRPRRLPTAPRRPPSPFADSLRRLAAAVERTRQRRKMREIRAARERAGLCACGGVRDDATFRSCGRCRLGIAMRVHTSLFRKREGLR